MSRRHLRLALWLCLLAFVAFCVIDLCAALQERGTLVLEQQAKPGATHPRIQVEIYFLEPVAGYQSNSVLRKLGNAIEDGPPQRERPISAHHDTNRVLPLRLVDSRWSEPGTRWEVKLKPGKYLLAREIWAGREHLHAHSGFQYRTIEVKPGERIEIDDLFHGWTR